MKRARLSMLIAAFACSAFVFLHHAGAQASIQFERGRMRGILDEVAREIQKNFYDANLRGLNWTGAVEEARGRIDAAKTSGEMMTAIFSLVYKLNDSHTVFIPPFLAADVKFGFEAKAYGDEVRIYEVKKGGAAAGAGLQVGDRILGINGFAVNRENIDLMLLLTRRLRPTTTLKILYERGNQAPQEVVVTAQVKQKGLQEDLTRLDNIWKYIREAEMEDENLLYSMLPGDIGYVKLPDFSAPADTFSSLLSKIKNAKAVIVDVRGNPGGAVPSLENFVGFFEEEPAVIAEMVGRKKTEMMRARPHKPYFGGPLFILADSQSSSAAEVFTRYFQRTGRAVVVGDRTSGRVTAARVFPKQFGSDSVVLYGVQVAVAQVVFPGGEQLERRGVTPDKVCIPSGDDLREERDPCFSLAVSLAREKLGLPPAEAEKK